MTVSGLCFHFQVPLIKGNEYFSESAARKERGQDVQFFSFCLSRPVASLYEVHHSWQVALISILLGDLKTPHNCFFTLPILGINLYSTVLYWFPRNLPITLVTIFLFHYFNASFGICHLFLAGPLNYFLEYYCKIIDLILNIFESL